MDHLYFSQIKYQKALVVCHQPSYRDLELLHDLPHGSLLRREDLDARHQLLDLDGQPALLLGHDVLAPGDHVDLLAHLHHGFL